MKKKDKELEKIRRKKASEMTGEDWKRLFTETKEGKKALKKLSSLLSEINKSWRPTQKVLEEKFGYKEDIWTLIGYWAKARERAALESGIPPGTPWSKVDWEKVDTVAIDYFIKECTEKRTFALPSNPVMFTLLAMFSGKPEKIPRKLLAKPYRERTPQEQKEAEEFLESILAKDIQTRFDGGQETEETKTLAIVSNNPIVEANAEIDVNLFSQDITFREEALAIYIKRTFGAEGLRHLLGLIIGLEENYRTGYFEWEVNKHLKRLGYKKKRNRSFDSGLKKKATEIVKIFSSLFLTARRKDKDGKEVIQGERLFSIDGFKLEIFNKDIIDEALKLRATDFWYKNAFDPPDGKAPMYTKLLKKIAIENHRNHPLTIYLAPLLAIFWRMKPDQKLSIESLMKWCNIDVNDPHKKEKIREIEAELNYMKDKGYLGNWTNNGERALPSECKEPLKCILTFIPPKWLEKEIKEISDRKEKFLAIAPQETKEPVLTKEEFARLLNNTGYTQKQFANHLGISRQMVSYIIHGKRKLTPQISKKVKEIFGHMLPV